jgi:opacity protein-like surface antigen
MKRIASASLWAGYVGAVAWRVERRASLGAAVTAEWVRLADDTDEATGARARNSLLSASVGPTLGVWLGPVRPWVGGFAGMTLSLWSTEWSGQRGSGSDSAFAWGAGAGLQVRFTVERPRRVSMPLCRTRRR